MKVTEDHLQEVASVSKVLDSNDDFVDKEFREKYEQIIPVPEDLEHGDYVKVYLALKNNII